MFGSQKLKVQNKLLYLSHGNVSGRQNNFNIRQRLKVVFKP